MRSMVDEGELLARARRGDRAAKGVLLQLHAAAIARIVSNFCRKWARWHPDEEDLTQEARILFASALEEYDPARGSFAGYMRFILTTKLLDSLGANSTLRRSRRALGRQAERQRAGHQVAPWAKETVSLDEEQEGGGTRLEALVGSDPGPAAIFERRELEALALQHVAHLDPVHADILRRRYLADVTEGQAEIGASMGVSRARVGQLEAAAIEIVRGRVERATA